MPSWQFLYFKLYSRIVFQSNHKSYANHKSYTNPIHKSNLRVREIYRQTKERIKIKNLQ